MKNIPKEWIILIIVSLLVVIVGVYQWYNNPSPTTMNVSGTTAGTRIEKEEAEVDVIVEYLPEKSTSNNMVLQIALDTHSVNLDEFDFQKDVRIEKDEKSNTPLTINQSGSGHHRKAAVTFTQVTTPFTIVVRNVSNIPRREFQFTNL